MTGKKVLENQIQGIAKTELKKARANISRYMEGALLSLIGLEKKGWGNNNPEFEVDHCNGRNSVIIDAFREIAIDEARKIASGYKPTGKELDIYRQAFIKEVKNQFSYAMRDAAIAKAKELANQAAEKIQINIDELLEEELGIKPEKKV